MAHKRKKTEDLILIHITINDGNEYEGLCSCDKSFCYPSIGFEGWGEYYYDVKTFIKTPDNLFGKIRAYLHEL